MYRAYKYEKKKNTARGSLLLLTALSSSITFSASQARKPYLKSLPHFLSTFVTLLKQGHGTVQLGGYQSTSGVSQHINIDGLVGDTFTVTRSRDNNAIVGLGYYIEGQTWQSLELSYGINGFYLPRTSISGNVIQEDLFTNLSYGYHLTHYPVYATIKSTIPFKSMQSITVDVGVGPNFLMARGFQEYSLDNGVTTPDVAFSGRTTPTFSATIGVGIQIKNVFGKAPLECGYKFFYLGRGHFNTQTNQILNTLNTGNTYANALLCGIRI